MRVFSLLPLFIFGLLLAGFVSAQSPDAASLRADTTLDIANDTRVQASDLDVSDPSILPGEFLYGFKELGRATSLFFTFNTQSKAEKAARVANERLLEIRALINEGADDMRVQQAAERYKSDMARVSDRLSALDQEERNQISGKIAGYHVVHQQLLSKLETMTSDEQKSAIESAKKIHATAFSRNLKTLKGQEQGSPLAKAFLSRQKNADKTLDSLLDLKTLNDFQKDGDFDTSFTPFVLGAKAELFKEFEASLEDPQDEAVRKRIDDYTLRIHDDTVESIDFIAGLRRASMANTRQLLERIEAQQIARLETQIESSDERLQQALEDPEKREFIESLPLSDQSRRAFIKARQMNRAQNKDSRGVLNPRNLELRQVTPQRNFFREVDQRFEYRLPESASAQ